MSHPIPEPDLEDVLQVENPEGQEAAVKVDVTGPVRTQALPRKAASTVTRAGLGTFPPAPRNEVLTANPRRSSATLVSTTAFLVAFNQASAQTAATMTLWPANVPLTVTAAVDIWVVAPTGTVDVGIVAEYWATGDGDE